MAAPTGVTSALTTSVSDTTLTLAGVKPGDLVIVAMFHAESNVESLAVSSTQGGALGTGIMRNDTNAWDGIGQDVQFYSAIATSGQAVSGGSTWTITYSSGVYSGSNRRMWGGVYRHALGWEDGTPTRHYGAAQHSATGAGNGAPQTLTANAPTRPCLALGASFKVASFSAGLVAGFDGAGGTAYQVAWGTVAGGLSGKAYDTNAARTVSQITVSGYTGTTQHMHALIVYATKDPKKAEGRARTLSRADADHTALRPWSARAHTISKATGQKNIGVYSAHGLASTVTRAYAENPTLFFAEGRAKTGSVAWAYHEELEHFRRQSRARTLSDAFAHGARVAKALTARTVSKAKAKGTLVRRGEARSHTVSTARATGVVFLKTSATASTVSHARASGRLIHAGTFGAARTVSLARAQPAASVLQADARAHTASRGQATGQVFAAMSRAPVARWLGTLDVWSGRRGTRGVRTGRRSSKQVED